MVHDGVVHFAFFSLFALNVNHFFPEHKSVLFESSLVWFHLKHVSSCFFHLVLLIIRLLTDIARAGLGHQTLCMMLCAITSLDYSFFSVLYVLVYYICNVDALPGCLVLRVYSLIVFHHRGSSAHDKSDVFLFRFLHLFYSKRARAHGVHP